jgi:hypothetical protein
MRVIRIHTGADGGSLLQDLDVELRTDALGRISSMMPATNVFLRELKCDLVVDYHRGPRRQLIFFVSGAVEIESSDGVRRLLESGDSVLVEDTTGQGHITRVIQGPATCVYVPVPPEFDIAAFCRVT